MHLSMFSSRTGGGGGGRGEVAGILWGLHIQNSHTALGNLTDDFGTRAAPQMFRREN